MAKMIPSINDNTLFNSSIGEKLVYDSLSTLQDAVVFHSVNWSARNKGRISQGEGDFVVYLPGRGVIVIEVKSSDIRFQEGKWYQKNRNLGIEHEIGNPLHQADRTKFELIDLFKKNNIDVSVISAVWFPNSNGITGNLPLDFNEELLFLSKDLINPKRILERAFLFCGFRTHDEDKQLRSKIIELVSPSFSVFTSGQGIIEDHNFHFNRMTVEQARILDFLTEQNEASIVGGAGTGKTILAIEKAKRLSEDGPVLFLCFNRFLVDNLKGKFSNHNNIEVHNPQSLFFQYNRNSKISIENLTLDVLNEFLLDMEVENWKYKHVVIDEGQDIDSTYILLLKDLCNKDDTAFFYVFYDQNQTVQNWDGMNWRKEIPCQLVLNTNCRNTVNIAKTSHSVLNLKNIKIKSDVVGNQARLTNLSGSEELAKKLGQKIKDYLEQGYQLDDITIITLKTLKESALKDFPRVGSYKISIDNKVGRSVLFTTARKFKGLESNIVILIDIDSSIFKKPLNTMLFYVATSRAKILLDMYSIGSQKEYQELVDSVIKTDQKFPDLVFRKKLNISFD